MVVDIVPENNEDKSPWVVYMCADFKPLFISPITIPPQKTVLQMAKVRRTKEWAMLSPYWRQRILREGVCPEVSNSWLVHVETWLVPVKRRGGGEPAYDMAFAVMCMHTMTLQWCAPCVVASVQRSGGVL